MATITREQVIAACEALGLDPDRTLQLTLDARCVTAIVERPGDDGRPQLIRDPDGDRIAVDLIEWKVAR